MKIELEQYEWSNVIDALRELAGKNRSANTGKTRSEKAERFDANSYDSIADSISKQVHELIKTK